MPGGDKTGPAGEGPGTGGGFGKCTNEEKAEGDKKVQEKDSDTPETGGDDSTPRGRGKARGRGAPKGGGRGQARGRRRASARIKITKDQWLQAGIQAGFIKKNEA